MRRIYENAREIKGNKYLSHPLRSNVPQRFPVQRLFVVLDL